MKLLSILLLFLPVTAFAIEAQKIAAIKGGTETLWQFLAKLPASFEAQVFYGLFFSGLAGAVSSWLWKWSQGKAAGVRHFTIRYSIGQVLWLAGSSVGAIATVGFSTESGEFFGWLLVLWTGALAGFGGEVKNTQEKWTDEQRRQMTALDALTVPGAKDS